MAGKGSECGRSFDEIKYIINHVDNNDCLGVCLDTCHLHDAGYDLAKFDDILAEFDQKIGLERLLVVHVNDSKNECGASKDRHENIGYGHIGFDTLNMIVHHEKLKDVPKILETPYVEKIAPYKDCLLYTSRVFYIVYKNKLSIEYINKLGLTMFKSFVVYASKTGI